MILELFSSEWFWRGLCAALCLLHVLISVVLHRRTGKKIKSLCQKCGLPEYDDEPHECSPSTLLTSTQLKALSAFIAALKAAKENDDELDK